MPSTFEDIVRFWRHQWWKSAVLFVGCTLVASLAALNSGLLSNSLWYVPPGVNPAYSLATIGAFTPEGEFAPVGKREIEALERTDFRGAYSLYTNAESEVSIDGKEIGEVRIALVSQDFFRHIGTQFLHGESFGETSDGVVVSAEFWNRRIGSEWDDKKPRLDLAGISLPVIGVTEAAFRGIEASNPEVYVPVDHFAEFQDFQIPFLAGQPPEVVSELAEQLPAFFGIVRLNSSLNQDRLFDEWHVRNTDSIQVQLPPTPLNPAPKMTLGFNAVGFKPAVNEGVDFEPGKTATLSRYVRMLTGLSGILSALAAVSVWAFWSNRAIDRIHELQVRVAVGAGKRDLLSMFILEGSPFMLGVALLSVPLALIQFHALLRIEPFSSYFADRVSSLSSWHLGASLLVVACAGAISLLAPFLVFRKSVLRVRTFGEDTTTLRFRNVVYFAQWFFLSVVTVVAVSSTLDAMQLARASWGGSASPRTIKFSNRIELEKIADVLQLRESDFATLSIRPLSRLKAKNDYYVVSDGGERITVSIYSNYASIGFADALGLNYLAGEQFSELVGNEIVVSASVAQALKIDPRALIGRRLTRVNLSNTLGREDSYLVKGVIGDVRYSGLRNSPELVIYSQATGSYPGTLFVPAMEGAALQTALTRLSDSDSHFAERISSSQTMLQVRNEAARSELALTYATVSYAMVALAFLALGLAAEAKAIVSQSARELALRIAVGWPLAAGVYSLISRPMRSATLLTGVGVFFCSLIFQGESGDGARLAPDWQLIILLLVIALVAFFAGLSISARLLFRRSSIATVLRHD